MWRLLCPKGTRQSLVWPVWGAHPSRSGTTTGPRSSPPGPRGLEGPPKQVRAPVPSSCRQSPAANMARGLALYGLTRDEA
eukprot:4979486-Pyramimonas_sp.AAC.1